MTYKSDQMSWSIAFVPESVWLVSSFKTIMIYKLNYSQPSYGQGDHICQFAWDSPSLDSLP